VHITTKFVSSNPAHGEVYSIQHYVIKFVSNLWQVGGILRVLRFPPPIKLTSTIYNWNIVESVHKHYYPNYILIIYGVGKSCLVKGNQWPSQQNLQTGTLLHLDFRETFVHDIPSHVLKDEKQKYHIVKAVPKSNRKIVKRQLFIDTPSIYIYFHSLSWLGIFN